MNLFLGLFAVAALLLLLTFGCYSFGCSRGYQCGFHDGEEWWWKLMRDCEEEREKLWREELRK